MKDFFQGAYQALGAVAGIFPIGISFGALAIQAGLSSLTTIVMSMAVYAGASQFAALESIKQQLPWWSIVVTILVINLRMVPMSFAARKVFSRFGLGQQFIFTHGIIDETFALDLSAKPRSLLYYLGTHLSCWIAWVSGTILGCQFGTLFPEKWLNFALPSLFLCLLCDNINRRWNREVLLLLGAGIAVVLATKGLGALGIFLAIVAISLLASCFPNLEEST